MTRSQRYYESIREERSDWADSMPQRCMRCLKPFVGFRWREIHEIERRSHARKWWHRSTALLLCHICHDEMGDAKKWPHARQLWLKRRMDREHFDLKAWLSIAGRPASYVTEKDLDEWDSRSHQELRYVTEAEVEACR